MTTQQPEALAQECADYATSLRSGANVANLKGRAPSVSFLRAADLFERAASRITELESQLAQRFDAADMATAAAQGFRDGVASLSASAGATLRSMIEGMSVSVDVSTGDHDAGHRYFGTVTEVMECQGDKHGVTLLVQDAEPNFTATPTSGAADLRTAAQAVVDRWDTPLWKDVPATAEYIGRLRAALAAGQATAAQPGVDYAELPDEGEPWRGHKFKEVQRGCWRCDCGKTIKEVTSDQSTPASGGNYPVMPKRYTVDDDGEELFTAEKMRAFADATHTLRASLGQAPAQPDQPIACSYGDNGYACCEGGPCQADVHNDKLAEQQAPATAQADSMQEDAACWHWLAEYLVGTRTDLDDEIVASETVNDLRKLVKAAIKQGEKQ